MNKNKLSAKNLSLLVLGFLVVLSTSCDKTDTTDFTPDESIQSGERTMATTTSTSLLFQNSFEETNALSNLYLEKANSNSILRTSEQANFGSYSSKFTLNKSDAYVAGSKRSEATIEWVETPKFERWYGFSMFLPSSYISDTCEESVFQWHAINSVDLDGASMNNSAMAMFTKNGRWIFNMKYGGDFDFGAYEKNAWTDWVVHVKFSHESDGVIEIWKNGVKVLSKTGRNNYRDLKGNFFKIGIYKYGWPQGYTSNTTSRSLYFDEVKIGSANSSYASVAPGSKSSSQTPAPAPTPTPTPTPAPAPAPVSSVVYAVNGGDGSFKASNGITYLSDRNYSGGFSHRVTSSVSNTTDDRLFQIGHYGTRFSYKVPLTNGTYDVTFSFVENYNYASGKRRFDVFAENIEIIRDLDIFSQVGKSKAYFVTKRVTVKDGYLDLYFRGDRGDAMVSAFHITKK